MNFMYSVLFGLNYYSGIELFVIDIASIPKEVTIEKIMYYMKSKGNLIIDSSIDIDTIDDNQQIITNAYYF